MKKKPNSNMRKHTAPELPLLAFFCGALALSSPLFAGNIGPVIVDESECLVEIDGDVLGDMDTDITLDANGGNAVAYDFSGQGAGAPADACAIAIDGDVEQDGPDAPVLSATFDLTAQGGESEATSDSGTARANSQADVYGVEAIEGDFTGSITGEATAGDATALGSTDSQAYADAYAEGITAFLFKG